MATFSSRFRIKNWSEQSDLNRWLTVLQTVAFDRLAMLAKTIQNSDLDFLILNFELIWRGRRDSNPQFSAWRAGGLTDLPTSSLVRVKRFELLHKLGLNQSPLPLGYTRLQNNTRGKIWTCAEKFLKLLPIPIVLREQIKIRWTERDSNPYEKFAGLLCSLVTSSARNKNWCRRRDFHPHESRSHKAGLNLVRLIIPPLRREK